MELLMLKAKESMFLVPPQLSLLGSDDACIQNRSLMLQGTCPNFAIINMVVMRTSVVEKKILLFEKPEILCASQSRKRCRYCSPTACTNRATAACRRS
jgi:hypothetical protein